MRVLSLRGDSAVCIGPDGSRHQVAIELVQPLRPGDEVLVHAGVAIR